MGPGDANILHRTTGRVTEREPGAGRKPELVLVGGAPASGKTMLACELARELGLPLLTKDQIKESLFDTLGVADQDHSIRLSIAAYRLLYRLAQQLLDAGTSLILEANFQHGPSEESLRPLASCARTRLIQCVTSVDEIRRRYDARMAGRTDRHPGHNDAAALPRVLDQLDRGVYQPLDLGVPTLLVDTTTGYHPSLAAIVVWLRCPALAG